MENRTRVGWALWLGLTLGLALSLADARAQQQPTPSPSPKAAAKPSQQKPAASEEQKLGNYNIVSSIEIGVRGLSVSGSDDKYRSDLNYKPGVRLFDSSFLLRSKDQKGLLFDDFLVNTSGWGGDPSGYTRVNVEKTGLYRFDANFRRVKYFNNLTNLALNQHTYNTRHQFAD